MLLYQRLTTIYLSGAKLLQFGLLTEINKIGFFIVQHLTNIFYVVK